MILKNGVKYGFPFEDSILAAAKVADEVVVVDGGSDDLTMELLDKLAIIEPKVKVFQHEWDMENPTLFGDEKSYARSKCTGTHLIQLDADEIISEPKPGMIFNLIRTHRFDEVLDLPVINFYGNNETIRIEPNCWKWRISRNDEHIVHGVHAEARIMDEKTFKITMDKSKSDACEYIDRDSMKILHHVPLFDPNFVFAHERIKAGQIDPDRYVELVKRLIANGPVVYHYSWMDLERKAKNGEFWDKTFHGQRDATHNTTKDIEKRVSAEKDMLLKIDFDHPLKDKPA